jgi:hypothetical protein
MASDVELEVRADLDVPGETGRQARVLGIWVLCLILAVGLAILRRPQTPATMRQSPQHDAQVETWRRERLLIALLFGLALPAALTWRTTQRHRRGGAHARGITVDVTREGELRLWGRGYGERVALAGAELGERLVDVYSGRQGAWRQRRLRVRPKRPLPGHGLRELELATPASDGDLDLGLRLEGGEGNCVELGRDEYLKVLELVQKHARTEL